MTAIYPTPAVERVSGALPTTRFNYAAARMILTAALTDPDDPDWLARTLFVLNKRDNEPSWSEERATQSWDTYSKSVRIHWRAVADGLRATLTGSGA